MRPFAVALLLLSFVPSAAAADPAEPALAVDTLATLPGGVGGVAVDRLGNVFVADFEERVFKVDRFGAVTTRTSGLYGSSGNAVDGEGRLLQSSFFAGTLSRLDRDGRITTLARGLEGPVGVTELDGGDLVVCACQGNKLQRVSPSGEVSDWVTSDLFRCPNGITRGPDGSLYVVSFNNATVVRVDEAGTASALVTLPSPGNGHVVWAAGALYVTSFRGNRIFRVTADGEHTVVAGSGRFAAEDGPGVEASFANPNGIAYDPVRDLLYVNDFLTPYLERTTGRKVSKLRRLAFPGLAEEVTAALEAGGAEAAVAALERYRRERPGRFTEIEVNILGYQLMGRGELAAALTLFTANTEHYPASANTWDSLAEATAAAGDVARARELYRKSLDLNPGNANAVKMLEQLSAD